MGESDLTSSKTTVKREPWEGEVTEEEAKKGLGEEGLVGVHVDHTLLGDGQVSGLANEEIGPLHDDDGYQVTALSVVESLDGVTDLVLGDSGVLPEFGNIRVGTPTALRPLIRCTVNKVKTDIDGTLTGSDHVESLTFETFSSLGVTFVI